VVQRLWKLFLAVSKPRKDPPIALLSIYPRKMHTFIDTKTVNEYSLQQKKPKTRNNSNNLNK
jgi:hypothetical protein